VTDRLAVGRLCPTGERRRGIPHCRSIAHAVCANDGRRIKGILFIDWALFRVGVTGEAVEFVVLCQNSTASTDHSIGIELDSVEHEQTPRNSWNSVSSSSYANYHFALDEIVAHLSTISATGCTLLSIPERTNVSHVRLFPTRNEGVTSIYLSELTENDDVDDTVFLVDLDRG